MSDPHDPTAGASGPGDRSGDRSHDRPGGDPTAGPGEPVGSVGEEAAKLLGAFSEWAKDHGAEVGLGLGGLAGQAAAALKDVDEHLATGSAECTYCPVCRTVHVVRRTSPEVRAHLATAASALMQAAAGLMAPPAHASGGGTGSRTAAVERIDLDAPGDPGGPDLDGQP